MASVRNAIHQHMQAVRVCPGRAAPMDGLLPLLRASWARSCRGGLFPVLDVARDAQAPSSGTSASAGKPGIRQTLPRRCRTTWVLAWMLCQEIRIAHVLRRLTRRLAAEQFQISVVARSRPSTTRPKAAAGPPRNIQLPRRDIRRPAVAAARRKRTTTRTAAGMSVCRGGTTTAWQAC